MTLAFIATALETALNYALRLDSDSLPRLAALEGKVIAIEMEGVGRLYVAPKSQYIRVVDQHESEPSVWIRGAPLALFRQWRGGPAAKGNGVAIEGDAALARDFQRLLARLDIDWEEQFSRWIGDAAAHQLSNFWRGFRGWGQRVSGVAARNSAEYLQQELALFPPQHAVERFLAEVDQVREGADRLTARIERLRRRLAGGEPS
ncbi:MAG: SCP2 sterol-binding domain-containing protein [Candidatus Competibacteraceae bacterium]|nr:SCP2 sterol-binding domain-containing protein [Candidatus Competibacteraceae bacterium]